MNNTLQLKLKFKNDKNKSHIGPRNLKKSAEVSTEKIQLLIDDLHSILRKYEDKSYFLEKLLIDVNYNDIVAKSNRIQALFRPRGGKPNDLVVGARFSDDPKDKEKHIITYYVDKETVKSTIRTLESIKIFLDERLGGKATKTNFNEPENKNKIQYDGFKISKSKIRDAVVDCSVINSFSVPHIQNVPDKEAFLITFYETELSTDKIFKKINITNDRYIDYGNRTISVDKELFNFLKLNVPYLISMVSDLSNITLDKIQAHGEQRKISIPSPTNEPTIGVIDTLFDKKVYFSEWVESIDYIDKVERTTSNSINMIHGTAVSSIIVDGPRLNPWLDDGCGRFKVRHFGICEDRISMKRFIKKVQEIVINNPDIHVWNLSLGTDGEVSNNFISYDAWKLDELQSKNNIIFVVSGTNDNRNNKDGILKVGSPADSLNSIVVNSVKRDGTPASYTRKGNILSFFNKPDISYYGGDYNERIQVYTSQGETGLYGTSFAAPWISRKLCYLIDIIGLPREVAKALLIDSAAGWEYKQNNYKHQEIMGYGIVPIDISEIISSENREIKFVLYGTSKSYKTFNYTIPVPKDSDNKYPYIARATMCYFPECSRLQGVDYTNRELSLQFGRVKPNHQIDDINDNTQDIKGSHVNERISRTEFRKWENTKFISKILKSNRPIKSYESHQWGISITSKERLSTQMNKELNFGIVITLREVNGINRINDFITLCNLSSILVTEIDIENKVNLYNNINEELNFD